MIAVGQFAEGLKVALTIEPGVGYRETFEAIARSKLGDRAAADRAFDRLKALDHLPYEMAMVHARRGEIDAAFTANDRAVATREVGVTALKGDPMMRPLHGDPRLAAVIRRIAFP